MTEFISVLMLQFNIVTDANQKSEWLVFDKAARTQFDKSIELISRLNPDIVVYPEMCYVTALKQQWTELSKNSLIVAGSHYENGINNTVVFQNGSASSIPKLFASAHEPMFKTIGSKSFEDVEDEDILKRKFCVKDKDVYVLNCMEYYQLANLIVRSSRFNRNLFGLISPCSNSRTSLFVDESKALHNHNEKAYSFVCNSVSKYMGKQYANGQSYVYGPTNCTEDESLTGHPCQIVTATNDALYIYGEFAIPETWSPYKRSDFFAFTPRNLRIKDFSL